MFRLRKTHLGCRGSRNAPAPLRATIGACLALVASVGLAQTTQSLTVPAHETVYAVPMATVDGQGAVAFHITFGVLIDAKADLVGLYRSYPSKSKTPLSEVYGLGMLATRAGVILSSYHGLPLLALHGHLDDQFGRNRLTLTYLTRALQQRYASCVVEVVHTRQGTWKLANAAGVIVQHVTVQSRTLGIRSVSLCAHPGG